MSVSKEVHHTGRDAETIHSSFRLCFSLVGLCVLLLLFSSCGDDSVEVFSQSMELGGQWAHDNELSFEIALPDTSTNYDIQLLIDNTDEYVYKNMYVFVNMQFPNEKWLRDTVEFYLTDQTGRWLGKSKGDGHLNEVLYKHRRKLPLAGDYRITMRHGMRSDELKGIRSAGIRITESK